MGGLRRYASLSAYLFPVFSVFAYGRLPNDLIWKLSSSSDFSSSSKMAFSLELNNFLDLILRFLLAMDLWEDGDVSSV